MRGKVYLFLQLVQGISYDALCVLTSYPLYTFHIPLPFPAPPSYSPLTACQTTCHEARGEGGRVEGAG